MISINIEQIIIEYRKIIQELCSLYASAAREEDNRSGDTRKDAILLEISNTVSVMTKLMDTYTKPLDAPIKKEGASAINREYRLIRVDEDKKASVDAKTDGDNLRAGIYRFGES